MVTFFEQMNSKVAFWLGYLMADGAIVQTCLTVSSIDKEILESFLKDTEISTEIKVRDSYQDKRGYLMSTLYHLSIADKELVFRLASYGITERKTHTAVVPASLELSVDFWRGYLEGNGYIDTDAQQRTVLELSTGSEFLAKQFHSFVCKNIPLYKGNVTEETGKDAWRVRLCGVYGSKLLSILYDEASPVCLRKYEAVQKCLSNYEKEDAPSCKECSSLKVVKDGKTKQGSQRYLCRDCGVKFITELSDRFHTDETKEKAIALYDKGVPKTEIARMLGIKAPTTLSYWINKERPKAEKSAPPTCPRCSSDQNKKDGKGKTGQQAYRCKDCKRQFEVKVAA